MSAKRVIWSLIKVPIIIVITYLFMNIILFTVFYFRALGMSYVVMQTAVENNYLPTDEANAIKESLQSLNSPSATGGEDGESMAVPIMQNTAMFIDTSGSKTIDQLYTKDSVVGSDGITNTSKNDRVQYGKSITVGVGYVYTAMLPLSNGGSINYTKSWTANAITIYYRVPGLKYYPDL